MKAQEIMPDGPDCHCRNKDCRHSFYEPKMLINPDFPEEEDAWIIAHRKKIPFSIPVCPKCGSVDILDLRPPEKHTFP